MTNPASTLPDLPQTDALLDGLAAERARHDGLLMQWFDATERGDVEGAKTLDVLISQSYWRASQWLRLVKLREQRHVQQA